MRLDRRVFTGLALLGVGHAGLLVTYRLDEHPGWTLGCIAVSFIGLVVAASAMARRPAPSAALILGLATLLRLFVLPLPPTLSDDILRYLWDGKVLAAGFDPYSLPPESEELRSLRDAEWEALPHKDVATVYPPFAQALFSIAARLPGSLYVLKFILACIELLGCGLLIALARRRGLPLDRVVWYAWNPLVVFETAGMGHVDAVGVAATIAVVLWLEPGGRRVGRAALAAAVGILAKIVPLLAVPMWARLSRRPGRFLTVVGVVAAVGFAPLAIGTGGLPPGLVKYAVSWEFNGPLFEPLWRLLDAIGAPRVVGALLDGLKSLTGQHDALNALYAYRYPQFLAKLALWAALAAAVLASLRQRDTIVGTGRLLGWVLLCSSTVYPWYLIWILPWAALCRQRAWLALSALVQLCYLPQLLGEPLFPWYFLAIWAPFAVLLLRYPRWSID